jgi:hypothetical protein
VGEIKILEINRDAKGYREEMRTPKKKYALAQYFVIVVSGY